MNQLPTFKGYVVDYRLQQFRKMVYGKIPQFIPFDSPKGQKLMNQYEDVTL